MAQEDDLRALGKVMDFMRGISVIFLLINCYWFCYEAFHTWGFTLGILDKILMNFQRTTGLFSSILWNKTLLCGFPYLVMFGNERRERRENHLVKDLDGAFRWVRVLLSELVVVGIAHR